MVKSNQDIKNENKLEEAFSKQIERTTEYEDKNGEKQKLKLVYNKPSSDLVLRFADAMQANDDFSDLATAYDLISSETLASPKLTYTELNKSISDDDKHKIITAENNKGETKKIKLKLPDFRTIFNIMGHNVNNRNGLNMSETTNVIMDSNYVQTPENKNIKLSDFDPDEKYDGLLMFVVEEFQEFIVNAIKETGALAILKDGGQFLSKRITIRPQDEQSGDKKKKSETD